MSAGSPSTASTEYDTVTPPAWLNTIAAALPGPRQSSVLSGGTARRSAGFVFCTSGARYTLIRSAAVPSDSAACVLSVVFSPTMIDAVMGPMTMPRMTTARINSMSVNPPLALRASHQPDRLRIDVVFVTPRALVIVRVTCSSPVSEPHVPAGGFGST